MENMIQIDLGQVAREVALPLDRVQVAVELLDDGNTVPFVTRYRKDQTGGLDEEQIRRIQEAVTRLRTLTDRKQRILKSLETQGRATNELVARIQAADSLRRLEDLYLPFKPKKQTLAGQARNRGLEPLAHEIVAAQSAAADLAARAAEFVNAEKGLPTVAEVLQGAGHLVAEIFSENYPLRDELRELMKRNGKLVSTRIEEAEQATASEDGQPETEETDEHAELDDEDETAEHEDEQHEDEQHEDEQHEDEQGEGEQGEGETASQEGPDGGAPAAELAGQTPTEETPAAETPVAEVPSAEMPSAEVPMAEAPVAEETPSAETPVIETPPAALPADAMPSSGDAEAEGSEAATAAVPDEPSDEAAESAPPTVSPTNASAADAPSSESATAETVDETAAAAEATDAASAAGPVAASSEAAAPVVQAAAKRASKPPLAARVEAKLSIKQLAAKSRKEAKQRKREKKIESFKDYFRYQEPLAKIPPHRLLAINRGERSKILRVKIDVDLKALYQCAEQRLIRPDHPHAEFLRGCLRDALNRLLAPSLEREVRRELTEWAELHAVQVFARNLRQLLLQSPVRDRRVLAVDPGFRSGCKLAALDEFGNVLGHTVIHVIGKDDIVRRGRQQVVEMVLMYHIPVIAIGNGTACRETERLIADIIAHELKDYDVQYAIVNEAGASVYSTSSVGREELPRFDPVLRSAVSIGRRLQDPLSELVKINPANIGVGLYQHDVKSKHLEESLDAVVESCVNFVGVDANTASPALLRYVSGLNQLTARRMYEYRQKHGPFRSRDEFRKVPGFGDATFVQAAGFLKIIGGDNPLDATWIHPESYDIAQRVLEQLGGSEAELARQVAARGKLAEASRPEFGAGVGHEPDAQADTAETVAAIHAESEAESMAPTELAAEPTAGVELPTDAEPQAAAEPPTAAGLGAEPQVTPGPETAPPPEAAVESETAPQIADETAPPPESKPEEMPSGTVPESEVVPESELAPQPGAAEAGAEAEASTAAAVEPEPVVEPAAAPAEGEPAEGEPAADQPAQPSLAERAAQADVSKLAGELRVGEHLLHDILNSLKRPGRDPREDLPKPAFRREIIKLEHLHPGMELTGTVLNVVDFGAFVDIGLPDSGLIHISRLADRFVKDPHEVVCVGDIVNVWVVDVDKQRRRVSLTAIKPGTERPAPERRERPPTAERPAGRGEGRSGRPPQGRRSEDRRPGGRQGSGPRGGGGRPRVTEVRPSKPKPVRPITDAMAEGKEPMRSFSDLLQFYGRKPEDGEDPKKKKKS
jgi:protein Tex